MNKKAFFFTLTAILLLTLLLYAASLQLDKRLSEKTEPISARILVLNDFAKNSQYDLERGMYISGFRSILSAQEYISTNGKYLSDSQANLAELIINGTINRTSQSLMNDSTLPDWANRLQSEAEKIDAIFNVTILSVQFSQTSSWEVTITANVTLRLYDKKKTASWDINKTITTSITIIGLEDPAYTVESMGRVIVPINITPYEANYVSGTDVANLLDHTYAAYFTNSTGPSFLMRLEGNFSNSTVGIESLIDLSRFQEQGLAIYDRSIVDHVYFSGQNTTIYRINGTPSWFKIDESHLAKYQVTGLTS